jgi:hypothetical protein
MYYRRFSQEPYSILDLSCLVVQATGVKALAEGMGKVEREGEEVATFHKEERERR